MSTTKPDTDTGWSKEFPQAAGTYWLRSVCNPASAVVVVILGDYIKFTSGTSERFSPKAGYEFLGPISPSDFEQLLRLRRAAEAALLHLQGCGYKTNQQVQEQLIAALREALTHTGGKS